MIKSKKLIKNKNIKHGFFNSVGGKSKNIYTSLNCGTGSKDSRVATTMSGDVSSNGTIFFGAPNKIVAIDSTGKCVGVIPQSKHGIAMPKYLEIRNIGGDDILFVLGKTFMNGSRQHKGFMYVMNLGAGSDLKGKQKRCSVQAHQLGHTTKKDKAISMTVSKDGTYYHFSRQNRIYTFLVYFCE